MSRFAEPQRFAEPMSRLIEELRKLPGVGSKSAQRLAFHILRASNEDADALSAAIRELKSQLRLCSLCNNITDVDPCILCTNTSRNARLVCVVEEPTNIASVEKTRSFNGLYHVLHGTLSPLNNIGPDQLRTASLFTRVRAQEIDEIILATSPTIEGEATASWLAEELRSKSESNPELKITRIATGIPAGSDIEYADEVTLSRALEGRRIL
jgi:recombination protein RecR